MASVARALLDGRLGRPDVVDLGVGELHQLGLRLLDGDLRLAHGPRCGPAASLGQVVLRDLDGKLGRLDVGVGRRDLRAPDPARAGGSVAGGAGTVEAHEGLLDGKLGCPHVFGARRAVAELGQRVLCRINAGLGHGDVGSGRPGLELLQPGQRRLQAGLRAHEVATLRCLARRREANLRLAHLGLRDPHVFGARAVLDGGEAGLGGNEGGVGDSQVFGAWAVLDGGEAGLGGSEGGVGDSQVGGGGAVLDGGEAGLGGSKSSIGDDDV